MFVERKVILDLAQRIAREFQPEKIVLFGSYAYGTPTADSDVDLLVVMPFEERGTMKAVEIMHKLHPRIPLDLLVRSPEDLRRRLEWNDFPYNPYK